MTIPTIKLNNNNNNEDEHEQQENSNSNNNTKIESVTDESAADAENIYQLLWQCKTLGEAEEETIQRVDDNEYFELNDEFQELGVQSRSNQTATATAYNESSACFKKSQNIDDDGEWETDDEFMFSTNQQEHLTTKTTIMPNTYTLRSNCSDSSASTVNTLDSSVTEKSWEIIYPIATTLSHQLFRNICIFYSLTEPKLRAIKYDYNRAQAWKYYNNFMLLNKRIQNSYEISLSLRRHALMRNYVHLPKVESKCVEKALVENAQQTNFTSSQGVKVKPKIPTLPDSVQAWKFMLLDTNYIEDEEDMVSMFKLYK